MIHHSTSRSASLRPLILLTLSMVSLCIGTSYAKTLFHIVGPAGMTALRIGLGAAVLAAVQRPWRWWWTGPQVRAVAAYGAVLAVMNLSFYAAFARLPLGVAIAIEFLGPLGVAITGSRRSSDGAWVALAAAGVALLVLPGAGGAGIDLAGVGFALLAALFWAGYILAGKRAAAILPVGQILGGALLTASLIAVPVGMVSAGAELWRPGILLAGLVVAGLCSLLPYSLELVALRELPPRVFGIVVSLEPAIGALAALLVLGERLSVNQWAGMVAVAVASAGAILTVSRPPAAPIPAD